ncbi:MAG: type II secretion system protein GspE [Candidatus Rokuibacteriota bacterium]|nr:MAG: type II secretion system protein GspE [Candidatus Rokubacteria bacterium]
MAGTGENVSVFRRLGQILIGARLITPEVLQEGLTRAKSERRRLGDALTTMNAVSQDDVLRALATQQSLPFLAADDLPSTPPVIKNLSQKYLRQYTACPIKVDTSTITVATADPTNPLLLDELRQMLGLRVALCVAPPAAILDAIERAYGASTPLQKIVEGMGSPEAGTEGDVEADINQLRDMAFEAPVVRLVSLLIDEAVAAEASDIHVEPYEDRLRIRYRLDGILHDRESPPRRLQAALTSRIKLMAEMNIAERRLPQDGRIRVTAGDRRVDIRVSTVPTVHGESLVMRLLDRSSVFLPFNRLGFAPKVAEIFDGLIRRPHGILLVTGPTGSGKTTTLYAGLDKINSPEKKIITIEDPVEYQLAGVNQIPVRPKIGLSFATGLRHIVRQDPDVIMVGEIRDLETAEIAIQAALTGHLVFSTLHTNDAPSAVTRLQDMGAEAYLVASVLNGVLAQRLVRRICSACRAPYQADPGDLLALGVTDATGVELWSGKGCDDCRGTGYRGRTGIYELFVINEEARGLILSKKPSGVIRRHAIEHGMVSLRDDGWVKARAGVTTVEEILRVTQEDT